LETYRESSGYVREFPRQIYVVFLLKFLESYSYFAVSQIIVIYMHDEFGVPDVKAGAIYGMWGAIITLLGICTSWLNDGLGVRRAVLAGFSISSMALLILAFTRSRDAVFFVMLFLLPLGECMGERVHAMSTRTVS
jgi:dipeptide/tripeptide permease